MSTIIFVWVCTPLYVLGVIAWCTCGTFMHTHQPMLFPLDVMPVPVIAVWCIQAHHIRFVANTYCCTVYYTRGFTHVNITHHASAFTHFGCLRVICAHVHHNSRFHAYDTRVQLIAHDNYARDDCAHGDCAHDDCAHDDCARAGDCMLRGAIDECPPMSITFDQARQAT